MSGFKFPKPNISICWIILQYILPQEEASVMSKVSSNTVESCVIRKQILYWKNVSLSYLTSFIKPNIIGNDQFTCILFHTTFYIKVFKSQSITTAYQDINKLQLSLFCMNVISCVCYCVINTLGTWKWDMQNMYMKYWHHVRFLPQMLHFWHILI